MSDSICAVAEIPDGGSRLVERGGRKIALFRIGDEVFAFAAACPHKDGPLWEGQVSTKRCEVICPWHRFRFDLRSGKSVTYDKLVARTYPVSVRGGQVFVESLA
jgi:3-phenylpropionate/trans-cinnamate dioxygenase ferredoxin subunit